MITLAPPVCDYPIINAEAIQMPILDTEELRALRAVDGRLANWQGNLVVYFNKAWRYAPMSREVPMHKFEYVGYNK